MTNIKESVRNLLHSLEEIEKNLHYGDFYEFEQKLMHLLSTSYKQIVGYLVEKVSSSVEFIDKLRAKGKAMGFRKMTLRSQSIQIGDGSYVSLKSLYAEEVPMGYEGDRSLVRLYWGIDKGASLVYQSRVGQMSVLTPSFSIAQSVLENFGCHSNTERNRQLSLKMGEKGVENRVDNMLEVGESMGAKRVIIGIDGGRTRTREWKAGEKEVEGKHKYDKFDTPWREPKMLVISTIDEEGKMYKKQLPIYDTSFGDDELFDILRNYLKRLEINKARSVQVVADGAPWIWNRAKPLLLDLGVEESKIVETLDYYHAAQHLHELEVYLPKNTQKSTMKTLKEQLWEGNIGQMKSTLMELFPDWDNNPLKPFDYFEKNQHRMNYKQLIDNKLPIGSGIIESGIRRIINLRFKCPSAFWCINNLEPLFFLRAAFLSGRWNIFLNNLNRRNVFYKS
jgi:hypothetical protein